MNAAPPEIRKGRKYDQVLNGARQVFLADGFEGASVDDIARKAGVSKATLYSYFPDKKLLFLEVARQECMRQESMALEMNSPGMEPAAVLRAGALRMMRLFLSDFGRQMFRIFVSEAARFPDLGRDFYDTGPRKLRAKLVDYLRGATQRGELAIEDCDLAADQFAELCKADLFPRFVFGIDTEFTDAEIARVADGAVEMFMARYGPR